MATVHVTLGRSRGSNGRTEIARPLMPCHDSVPHGSETLTSTGDSQEAAPQADDVAMFWSVTAAGGNVYAAFGPTPDASTDPRWLILDGTTRDFGVCAADEKCAVMDA